MNKRDFLIATGILSISSALKNFIPTAIYPHLSSEEMFYANAPKEYFEFIKEGAWRTRPNQSTSVSLSTIVTEVHEFYCPSNMTYNEYISYSSYWIDWNLLDQEILRALRSGEIIKINFEFNGTIAKSEVVFKDLDSYNNRNVNYVKNNSRSFPGKSSIKKFV